MRVLKKTKLSTKLQRYLARDAQFRRVYAQTKKAFDQADLAAHNWEHIYRDVFNAIVIGEAEEADMRIVLPAITMHDIGFLYGPDGPTHAERGAQKFAVYLRRIRVRYAPEQEAHIRECIRTHKGSTFKSTPATREAQVVCDADMLEKFGAFGVYQYIRTWTEFGKGIESTIEHGLSRTEGGPYQLNTRTGRKLAEQGRKCVVDFFKALDRAYAPYR